MPKIYGPDAETRRAVAEKVKQAFQSVPFIVDVDDSYGQQAKRLRVTISGDDLEYYGVSEQDVFDTLQALNAPKTIGYSHRGGGRPPIPIEIGRGKGRKGAR